MKQENEYIVQFSGDGGEDPSLVSVAINQYWKREQESQVEDDVNQKGAE